ncbi:hypothetical protein L9F63_012626, partial [Diploptera punctata]
LMWAFKVRKKQEVRQGRLDRKIKERSKTQMGTPEETCAFVDIILLTRGVCSDYGDKKFEN